ncbi:MAG: Mur ligase family protein [Patescibacteria group bacterium]|nr:Mur ligase family protein [Patescibacteria group bacterium]
MKKLLQLKLRFLSRLILKKYHPEIVAISGSIGKTSTKEAIFQVLSGRLAVRTSIKNYNNEIGVPLTIIGVESPGSSLSGWLRVFWRAWRLYIRRDQSYPKVLILEMGIDRPGDMDYLTRLAPPTVGVITAVSYSHLEYFGSLQNIKKEKQVLIERVTRKGLSILNYDNEAARSMAEVSPARVLSFGLLPGADIVAQDLHYRYQGASYDIAGLNFKLNYEGNIVPVEMPNIIGEGGVYAALAAVAVALHFGLNLMEIASALRGLRLPAGRMQLLPGIKHTFLIDDSYNSSPEACLSALKVLGQVKIDGDASKYAVLGDMLEIGAYSEEGHALVGRALFEQGIDYLVSVGERSRDIDRGAKEAGMSGDFIFHFDDSAAAGLFVQERLHEGDVVLIKGSQGARMEKVTKELMAEPDRAEDLLVRQGPGWQD